MRSRLLAIVAVAIGLIFMTWLATNPAPQRRPAQTNGPLAVIVTGQITSTNELSVVQLEGLARRLAMTSSTALLGFTNALMIQITNRGSGTVELWGYDSASPAYDFYIDGPNGLERLDAATPEGVLALVYLGPTQSLSFPALPPATDRPCHVCVSYRDSIVPALPRFVRKPPTAFENLVVRIRAMIPFLRRPEPGFYYAMSDRIIAPERPNQTVQLTVASRPVVDTNRASSATGARR